VATTTDTFGDAVTEQTEQYFSTVRTCTALLPPALLRYEQNGFTDRVAELVTSESNCDEQLRELRTTLGTAEPNYTDVYLNTGAIMELFVFIDEIPNRAEQFLRELDAMRPPLDESVADALTRMAALVARGTRILTDAVADFVTDLVRSGEPTPVVETIDQVATLESRADDLKYEVITHAFDTYSTAQAVVLRDLVRSLDTAIDAAEDAADQLLYVHAGC